MLEVDLFAKRSAVMRSLTLIIVLHALLAPHGGALAVSSPPPIRVMPQTHLATQHRAGNWCLVRGNGASNIRGRQRMGGAFHVPRGGSSSVVSSPTAATSNGQAFVSPATTTSPSSTALAATSQESETSSIPPLEYNQTAAPVASAPLSDIVSTLQSDPSTGLSQSVAKARLSQYGPNALIQPPGKSLLDLIAEQFEDRLVQILLAVAALSGVFSYFEMKSAGADGEGLLKSFVEPLVILAILVLNAAVGVWQSRSAEGSLEALKRLQPSLATVMRDGKWIDGLDASELVPGDVISFRVGDKISADARVLSLQTSTLSVDEGSLTGESVTVQKLPGDEGLAEAGAPVQDMRSVVFSGTMVTSGSGTAVVVRTGMNTEIGKIQKGVTEAKSEEQKTPLGQKLDEFGETLTVIIGVICLAVWCVSIPKFDDPSFSSSWEGALYYAKVAVALGVAAIPEGLPAVITLCLSLGTRRMAQRNVIVRKLPSVETLGCTSVICTDKTGTLTTNEMTAVSLVVMEREGTGFEAVERVVEHPISGFSYSPVGTVDGVEKDSEVRSNPLGSVADIAKVSALCNDAKIVGRAAATEGDHDKKKKKGSKESETEKEYERVGEPTEAALCVLAEKLGGTDSDDDAKAEESMPPAELASVSVDSWRSSNPRCATLEFSRDRKSMSVLCQGNEGKEGNRLFVKGAPNLLLERCTHIKFRDGTVTRLTGALRREIVEKTTELAVRPLRCLALAVKEVQDLDDSLQDYVPDVENDRAHPLLSDPSNYRDIETGLTLVGIVGIKDPARPEVANSIKLCSEAGIRVMMITGDARDTAVAIARDVNIFPPPEEAGNDVVKAYEGREFFEKPEAEQLELIKTGNMVFCRAEPADKQKLVKMLQSQGEIPAMTGDGVNDAPALQQAAIGIAMGITGTEVSKEAADMVSEL